MDITEIKDRVKNVMSETQEEVRLSGNAKDYEYFMYSRDRFERMAESLLSHVPGKSTVLNIGSHLLHSSMILVKLGYEVTGVDVSVFWDIDYVKEREVKYGVQKIMEDDLENFESMRHHKITYDVIIFAEILEHITFNPIKMWNRIYNLSEDGGLIYLTTPNSMALPTVMRALKDILFFNGIGTKVDDIFSHVTYGHHWKEYSKKEIKRYFKSLSIDFKVKVKHFSYTNYSGGGVRPWLWHQLTLLGLRTYFFAPALEVFIDVNKSQGFMLKAPDYN